jgi:hypothetical protein
MGEIISVESQSQQMEDPGFESKSDFRALALNNNASFVPGIYYTFVIMMLIILIIIASIY